MPTIPTFNNTKPLGDAPAPVLDRERRPTVDNSGVIAATGALGKIKSPLLPEGLADNSGLMAIGKAVQQGGNVVQALAIKRQEAETDVQVATADGAMQQERAKFEQWKQETNADPATWQEEWGNRVNQLRTNIFSTDKLTGGAQEQIGLRLQRYEGQTAADVALGATKETFARAKSAFLTVADNATETQDKERFEAALSTAQEKGYIFPEEAERARLHFAKVGEIKARHAEADSQKRELEIEMAPAIQDPQKWLEANKEPWKGREILWQRVKNAADAREKEGTAVAVDQLTNAIVTGDLTVPGEIDAWESPFLTPALKEQAKHYLASRDAYVERQDREQNGVRNAVEMRQRVKDYEPSKDPTREGYFDLVREIGSRVDQTMAGEITGELYKKYGTEPPKLKVRPELEQNVSKSLDTIFDPKQGAIPWRKEVPVLDSKGKAVLDYNGNPKTEWQEDLKAKQRAIDAQTVIETKMGDWFKENPNASLPEVKKKLNEFLEPGTRAGIYDAMGGLLKKPATPAGTSATNAPQAMNSAGLNDNLINTVKQLEGFEPKAFGDYKQLSIGYGTRAKHDGETITHEEADQRLRQELTMHAERVDKAAAKVGANLTEGQRNALISFDFNTGQGAELLTSSNGDLKEIARRMPLYIKAGGKTNDGLVNRRKAEMQLFNS